MNKTVIVRMMIKKNGAFHPVTQVAIEILYTPNTPNRIKTIGDVAMYHMHTKSNRYFLLLSHPHHRSKQVKSVELESTKNIHSIPFTELFIMNSTDAIIIQLRVRYKFTDQTSRVKSVNSRHSSQVSQSLA